MHYVWRISAELKIVARMPETKWALCFEQEMERDDFAFLFGQSEFCVVRR